ncbi:MAG: hypothetical protein HW374_1548 [Bacteroidetes bacterium]|nr:hypothetical protein [Bacteroidota bacterium]
MKFGALLDIFLPMAKQLHVWRTLYNWWMKFAHVLAVVNTTLLLTIVYVVLIGPMSLVAWVLRKDPLRHRTENLSSFWQPKEHTSTTLEQSRHLF